MAVICILHGPILRAVFVDQVQGYGLCRRGPYAKFTAIANEVGAEFAGSGFAKSVAIHVC